MPRRLSETWASGFCQNAQQFFGFFEPRKKIPTLPETNSSHLKMDGWNTSFLLGWPICIYLLGLLYWLLNRDPYNGFIRYNPRITGYNHLALNNQGLFHCSPEHFLWGKRGVLKRRLLFWGKFHHWFWLLCFFGRGGWVKVPSNVKSPKKVESV